MPRHFGTSAQFSRELLDSSLVQGMEIARPALTPLISTVSLGNNQGNYAKYVVFGNESEPRELFGNPIEKMERIGTYAFSMAPTEYGNGIQMTDAEISDATSPEWLDKARSQGAKVPYFLEKRLAVDILESATVFDGFDGQPLYSASHTWGTSDQTPGDPAPTFTSTQSNLIVPTSNPTVNYATTTAVLDDFYEAIATMNAWKDDKGSKIHNGEGDYYIVYNNQTAALDRYLHLAFDNTTLPSDDSARDGFRFNVKLIPCPHLLGTDTNDFDWYLFKLIPGQKPPLVVQERQGIQSETWRDPMLRMNYWQYTIRYGFGWTNWWQTLQINKG